MNSLITSINQKAMRIRISYLLIVGSIILFLVWVVMLFLFIFCPHFRESLGPEIGAAILAAIGAGAGFLFIKALEESQNARNSALALAWDISSIMTTIAKAGIAQHFMLQFASPQKRFLWADVAREENYFAVFEAQVGNLGAARRYP